MLSNHLQRAIIKTLSLYIYILFLVNLSKHGRKEVEKEANWFKTSDLVDTYFPVKVDSTLYTLEIIFVRSVAWTEGTHLWCGACIIMCSHVVLMSLESCDNNYKLRLLLIMTLALAQTATPPHRCCH